MDDRPLLIPPELPEGTTLTQFYESVYRVHLLPARRKQAPPSGLNPKQKYGSEWIHRTALRYWKERAGDPPLAELSGKLGTARLVEFRTALLSGKGFRKNDLSRQTINCNVRTIAALVGAAADLGWIERPRPVEPLAPDEEPVETYSLAELERLYDACEEPAAAVKFPRIEGTRAAHWWQALLVLAYATALRRGALVWAPFSRRGCLAEWVDRRERVLRVSGDKTVRGRWKPLRVEVIGHVDRLKHDDPHLLPFPHSDREFRSTRRAIWKEAEVPELGGKPLHALRATALSHIALSYGPAVEAARRVADHASDRTTKAHYLSLAVERQAVERMPWPRNWTVDDAGEERRILPFPAG